MNAGRASFGLGESVEGWSVHLQDPVAIREAHASDGVLEIVDWVDAQARDGRWGVLLLAYESAPAFDPALRTLPAHGPVPLAWGAAYDSPRGVSRADVAKAPAGSVGPWTPVVSQARFARDIGRILTHIAAGDTYQVNYTFPVEAPFQVDPWRWYVQAAAHAAVPYPAYVDLGDAVVMSLSPELFLERRGSRLIARPMKGTARRGRWLAEDERLARALEVDAKARAENVMIVDLLRNDLGRIAQTGSVQVRDLCRLERYPTVWQLTSTIEAHLPSQHTSLRDLLVATFPCGSVTGAPKVSTMAIIAALEAAARGLYTGAIVLLRPGGDFVASVPIRTVVLDRRRGRAVFGVGAGITADSVASDEWAECLAKARVVRPPAVPDDAALFETLRLEHGACVRADAHVRRLRDSARLFGWPCDEPTLREALRAVEGAHREGIWRARLFLERHGVVRTDVAPLDPSPQVWRVALARDPVDIRSPLVFNKTTCRTAYAAALAAVPGVDDVLLWNARGELTETTRANLVAVIDGVAVTPPLASGLLPGVMRGELLTRGEVIEQVVRPDDLGRASAIWLVNSLRGRIDVALAGQ